MAQMLMRFCRDDGGHTSIEYGLIAVVISVGILGGLKGMTGELSRLYNEIGGAVQNSRQ